MNVFPMLAAVFFTAAPALFAQSLSAPPPEPAPAEGEAAPPVNTTIPPELWRPARGEAPRYPVDTVIGPIGRGEAPESAYRFARQAAEAVMRERASDPALAGLEAAETDSLFSRVREVSPRAFRLGGGRVEPDGAVSFLVRYLGAEKSVTGELYIRGDGFPANAEAPAADVPVADTAVPPAVAEAPAAAAEPPPAVPAPAETPPAEDTASDAAAPAGTDIVWHFEDLILEDPADKKAVDEGQKFDFSPYHRFF